MLNLRTAFPMMSGIFNDGSVEDEKRKLQKRLEELIGRRGGEADMPSVSASMSIMREPVVDVGEPPPPDPNWQMEMIKRSMARPEMQPSYATGVETYPARNPAIPESIPRLPEVIGSDPELTAPNEQIGRVRVGQSTEGVNPLGRALITRDVMAGAGSNSKIDRSDPNFIEELPPKKRSRWKSFLVGAGLGALRGLANGPGGAIGGALTGGTIGAISPDTLSRYQRREELGQQDENIARQYQQQKGISGLADAETDRLYKLNQITRGQSELERKIAHDAEVLNLEREKAAGTITRGEADRRERQLDREERARHNKEVEQISRRGASDKPDTTEFTNSAIEQNIQEATTERDRIAEALKTTPHPIYSDYMKRYRELDDQIRDWRTKKKAPISRNGTYTEADIRARAEAASKNPDEAVMKAKAAGLLK